MEGGAEEAECIVGACRFGHDRRTMLLLWKCRFHPEAGPSVKSKRCWWSGMDSTEASDDDLLGSQAVLNHSPNQGALGSSGSRQRQGDLTLRFPIRRRSQLIVRTKQSDSDCKAETSKEEALCTDIQIKGIEGDVVVATRSRMQCQRGRDQLDQHTSVTLRQ